jgi:transposase InsO family protein
MVKGRRAPSQRWSTFLRNHAAGIAGMDFFVVPTIGFRLLYALVILQHDRRRIVSFGVTAHPTAEWITRQITEAFPWNDVPRYLIRDRDAAYGHVVARRLRMMGIRDRPTAPRSPWQNGCVGRLIGSIRREYTDHVVEFGETHLRRLLNAYMIYYNEARTHLSLGKDAPNHRPFERFSRVIAIPALGGLHHRYGRI